MKLRSVWQSWRERLIFLRKGSAIILTLPGVAVVRVTPGSEPSIVLKCSPHNLLSHCRANVFWWMAKKIYFILGSVCLYTRLKNNTGALDSFFFSSRFSYFHRPEFHPCGFRFDIVIRTVSGTWYLTKKIKNPQIPAPTLAETFIVRFFSLWRPFG